jgi:hypothetical protein
MKAPCKRFADPPFEEVELEVGFPLTLIDSSRPVLIDTLHSHSWLPLRFFLTVCLTAVFLCSVVAPKDHVSDTSVFLVSPESLNSPQIYSFHFSDLSPQSAPVWLSVFTLRPLTRGAEDVQLSIHLDWRGYQNTSLLPGHSSHLSSLILRYHHHHHQSDPEEILQVPVNSADALDINATVTFSSATVSGVVFEWSLNNPSNPEIQHIACHSFCLICILLSLCLSCSLCSRLEQVADLVYFALYLVSLQVLVSRHVAFLVVEKVMLCFVTGYLFYVLAVIANKHRNLVVKCAFVLLAISFVSEMCCIFETSKPWAKLIQGHNVGMHGCLYAVLLSIVAAMYFSIDDRSSFLIYAFLLCLSAASVLFVKDMRVVHPPFEHWVEINIAFYGIHGLMVGLLFYYHQRVGGAESEGDKLSGDGSAAIVFV